MKKFVAMLVAFMLLIPVNSLAADAGSVMDLFCNGDYQGLFDISAQSLQDALGDSEAYATAWEQMTQMLGGYVGIMNEEIAEQSGYNVSTLTCEFEKATATIIVTFDEAGLMAGFQIAGFDYKKVETSGAWSEEEIVLRPGEDDESAGLLTLPEGDGPFPCVIMMHGSGASDMDEMAYGFGVFSELAHALAERGVASLRYDKYPYAHPEMCAAETFGIAEEYTNDAKAALEIANADSRLTDVFLLGHSEGAMVAPRVAAELGADALSGLVLLEGSPKALWEILVRQTADSGSEEYLPMFEGMADMTEEELTANSVLGARLYYWHDQANYDYAGAIIENAMPAFISQGGKDFQVLPGEGVDAWREALGDYEGAEYFEYPDMTHLLYDIEGESSGGAQDYAQPGELNTKLADDIAGWICE